MRSWEQIRQTFIVSVWEHEATFEVLRARHSALARFHNPQSLLDHLAGRSGDLGEKDEIYAALVRSAQGGEAHALATAFIWLGLWPGLSAIYRRMHRRFPSEREQLVSDIAAALTSLIARLNFETVNRVFATLVWSTERDVWDVRLRALRRSRRELTFSNFAGSCGPLVAAPDEATSALHVDSLSAIVGRDRDLVLRVAVCGETQLEAAQALGISHEAARKRYQRALVRLRREVA